MRLGCSWLGRGTGPRQAPCCGGVFARGDSWLATGDLFRRDADGDYWLVDLAAAVVVNDGRAAYSVPVEDALGNVPAVELAVAYGADSVLVASVQAGS